MDKVVCVGSLNVDILLFVDEFAENEGEQIIKKSKICSGGQAGNIAAGLGKLGKKSFFFGNIGEDSYTEMLLKDFKESGVDYSFAKEKQGTNSYVYSIVNKHGERILYVYNDPNFSAQDFPEQLFEDTAFIVFSSIVKDDAIEIYTKIAKRARQRGIKTALEPGNVFARLGMEKLTPLLKECDYFFPSLSEVNLLVGSIDNIKEIQKIVPKVIVKLGGKGARLYAEQEFHIDKKPVEIIDTTGAGDCFTAAFISALMDGKEEKEAMDFAIHAAALSITKEGARTMPSMDEINEFINKTRIV